MNVAKYETNGRKKEISVLKSSIDRIAMSSQSLSGNKRRRVGNNFVINAIEKTPKVPIKISIQTTYNPNLKTLFKRK